jgi:membrane associated rhomboid family serine protease
MTLPPFAGAVRKLVLANAGVFLGLMLLGLLLPGVALFVLRQCALSPDAVLHGEIWRLVTYVFLEGGLLAFLLNNLLIWFCGSLLESSYGGRWFAELYFVSAAGGALLASAISFTRILHLSPLSIYAGTDAAIFGILAVIAARFGDLEFWIFFLIKIKAKYLVAIYVFINLALLLRNSNAFDALLSLCGLLAGYLYLEFAPRRGLAFGFSERFFGLRNAWYRAKRRRAARKFEVYMGKQGRKVHFDKEGRYLDPDEERKKPKDKRWMN